MKNYNKISRTYNNNTHNDTNDTKYYNSRRNGESGKPVKKKSFLKKVAILAGIVLAFNFISKNHKEKIDEPVVSENTITYSSYRELNDYAKNNANAFIEILKNHNIEYSTVPSGMVVANMHEVYEKYTNEYIYETVYKMSPDFNKNKCYENFYVFYQFPLDQNINEDYISIFVDAVNTLTEEKISLEELKNELSKEGFKSYRPNNSEEIYIEQSYNNQIKLNYERELNVNIAQGVDYTVENGMITGPKVKTYDTVQEYLDSTKALKEDFENKYGHRFSSFSYEINTGTFRDVKDVKSQFSQDLSIKIEDNILNDTEDIEVNTIISIIEEFCGTEIIDKDLMIEFIKSLAISTEYYQNFTPNYVFYIGEDIEIKLGNYRDLITNVIGIDIKIPVIAEGIGYVDLN